MITFHLKYLIYPCKKCKATDHNAAIHRTYICSKRCKCCGASDHNILMTITNEEGQKITDYKCPVLERPGHSLTTQLMNQYIRFRPSSQKFAEYYHFNIPNVQTAFEDLESYGCGKHMCSFDLNAFKDEVIQICEETRASWTFKRSSNSIEDDEDILDTDDATQL